MTPPQDHTNSQRSLIVNIILSIVFMLWIIQLFILMTSLDAWMGGETALLWPSAISSVVLTFLTFGLVKALPRDH